MFTVSSLDSKWRIGYDLPGIKYRNSIKDIYT